MTGGGRDFRGDSRRDPSFPRHGHPRNRDVSHRLDDEHRPGGGRIMWPHTAGPSSAARHHRGPPVPGKSYGDKPPSAASQQPYSTHGPWPPAPHDLGRQHDAAHAYGAPPGRGDVPEHSKQPWGHDPRAHTGHDAGGGGGGSYPHGALQDGTDAYGYAGAPGAHAVEAPPLAVAQQPPQQAGEPPARMDGHLRMDAHLQRDGAPTHAPPRAPYHVNAQPHAHVPPGDGHGDDPAQRPAEELAWSGAADAHRQHLHGPPPYAPLRASHPPQPGEPAWGAEQRHGAPPAADEERRRHPAPQQREAARAQPSAAPQPSGSAARSSAQEGITITFNPTIGKGRPSRWRDSKASGSKQAEGGAAAGGQGGAGAAAAGDKGGDVRQPAGPESAAAGPHAPGPGAGGAQFGGPHVGMPGGQPDAARGRNAPSAGDAAPPPYGWAQQLPPQPQVPGGQFGRGPQPEAWGVGQAGPAGREGPWVGAQSMDPYAPGHSLAAGPQHPQPAQPHAYPTPGPALEQHGQGQPTGAYGAGPPQHPQTAAPPAGAPGPPYPQAQPGQGFAQPGQWQFPGPPHSVAPGAEPPGAFGPDGAGGPGRGPAAAGQPPQATEYGVPMAREGFAPGRGPGFAQAGPEVANGGYASEPLPPQLRQLPGQLPQQGAYYHHPPGPPNAHFQPPPQEQQQQWQGPPPGFPQGPLPGPSAPAATEPQKRRSRWDNDRSSGGGAAERPGANPAAGTGADGAGPPGAARPGGLAGPDAGAPHNAYYYPEPQRQHPQSLQQQEPTQHQVQPPMQPPMLQQPYGAAGGAPPDVPLPPFQHQPYAHGPGAPPPAAMQYNGSPPSQPPLHPPQYMGGVPPPHHHQQQQQQQPYQQQPLAQQEALQGLQQPGARESQREAGSPHEERRPKRSRWDADDSPAGPGPQQQEQQRAHQQHQPHPGGAGSSPLGSPWHPGPGAAAPAGQPGGDGPAGAAPQAFGRPEGGLQGPPHSAPQAPQHQGPPPHGVQYAGQYGGTGYVPHQQAQQPPQQQQPQQQPQPQRQWQQQHMQQQRDPVADGNESKRARRGSDDRAQPGPGPAAFAPYHPAGHQTLPQFQPPPQHELQAPLLGPGAGGRGSDGGRGPGGAPPAVAQQWHGDPSGVSGPGLGQGRAPAVMQAPPHQHQEQAWAAGPPVPQAGQAGPAVLPPVGPQMQQQQPQGQQQEQVFRAQYAHQPQPYQPRGTQPPLQPSHQAPQGAAGVAAQQPAQGHPQWPEEQPPARQQDYGLHQQQQAAAAGGPHWPPQQPQQQEQPQAQALAPQQQSGSPVQQQQATLRAGPPQQQAQVVFMWQGPGQGQGQSHAGGGGAPGAQGAPATPQPQVQLQQPQAPQPAEGRRAPEGAVAAQKDGQMQIQPSMSLSDPSLIQPDLLSSTLAALQQHFSQQRQQQQQQQAPTGAIGQPVAQPQPAQVPAPTPAGPSPAQSALMASPVPGAGAALPSAYSWPSGAGSALAPPVAGAAQPPQQQQPAYAPPPQQQAYPAVQAHGQQQQQHHFQQPPAQAPTSVVTHPTPTAAAPAGLGAGRTGGGGAGGAAPAAGTATGTTAASSGGPGPQPLLTLGTITLPPNVDASKLTSAELLALLMQQHGGGGAGGAGGGGSQIAEVLSTLGNKGGSGSGGPQGGPAAPTVTQPGPAQSSSGFRTGMGPAAQPAAATVHAGGMGAAAGPGRSSEDAAERAVAEAAAAAMAAAEGALGSVAALAAGAAPAAAAQAQMRANGAHEGATSGGFMQWQGYGQAPVVAVGVGAKASPQLPPHQQAGEGAVGAGRDGEVYAPRQAPQQQPMQGQYQGYQPYAQYQPSGPVAGAATGPGSGAGAAGHAGYYQQSGAVGAGGGGRPYPGAAPPLQPHDRAPGGAASQYDAGYQGYPQQQYQYTNAPPYGQGPAPNDPRLRR